MMKTVRFFSLGGLLPAVTILTLMLSPVGAAAQTQSPAATSAATDVVAVLTQAGQFGTFLKLFNAAGLTETLRKSGPITVFAPTDEAFGKLPTGVLADLLKPENKERLTLLLNYHLGQGKLTLAELAKLEVLMTLAGEELEIDPGVDGKNVLIDDAKVKSGDLAAGNSIVHVIDGVLQP